MAAYGISADERAVHAKTLTASTEDTVTFAQYVSHVEVTAHPGGSAPIYITTDNTPAVIAGAKTSVSFPGNSLRLPVVKKSGPTVVRLICAEPITYSVSEA